MITERLDFQVKPGLEEDFITADSRIFDPWLRGRKGFVAKQIIRYPAGRVTFLIFWKTRNSLEDASSDPTGKKLDPLLKATIGPIYQKISSRVS